MKYLKRTIEVVDTSFEYFSFVAKQIGHLVPIWIYENAIETPIVKTGSFKYSHQFVVNYIGNNPVFIVADEMTIAFVATVSDDLLLRELEDKFNDEREVLVLYSKFGDTIRAYRYLWFEVLNVYIGGGQVSVVDAVAFLEHFDDEMLRSWLAYQQGSLASGNILKPVPRPLYRSDFEYEYRFAPVAGRVNYESDEDVDLDMTKYDDDEDIMNEKDRNIRCKGCKKKLSFQQYDSYFLVGSSWFLCKVCSKDKRINRSVDKKLRKQYRSGLKAKPLSEENELTSIELRRDKESRERLEKLISGLGKK